MFELYTDCARKTIVLAQEEARMMNHDHIGTEHLLLGLVREGTGVAAQSVGSLGVTLQDVRSAVERTIGRGEQPPPSHVPFTDAATMALQRALHEARQLGHNYIGTEHILLSLIAAADGEGSKLLASLTESNSEELRHHVLIYLAGHPSPERAPEQAPGATAEQLAAAGGGVPVSGSSSAAAVAHGWVTSSRFTGEQHIKLTAEEHTLITAAAAKAQTNIDTWIKERLLAAARAETSTNE